MSTYINVTVGKAGLSDQAKQQTNANRQAKLEADARDKAEVDGKRQRDANRALQNIGPDGQPLYGVPPQTAARKDEPAAVRNSAGAAFLLLCNINSAKDDIFEIFIQKGEGEPISLTGLADFTADDQKTTYLYLKAGLSLDLFKISKPYPVILKHLDTLGRGIPPYYITPPYSLEPVRPLTSGTYTAKFANKQNNFNGNYGFLIAGFTGLYTYWFDEWEGNSGESFDLQGIKWGKTNVDKISSYPDEYRP